MDNACQQFGGERRFGGQRLIAPTYLHCEDSVSENDVAALVKPCPISTVLDSGELVLVDETGTIPAGFRDITVRLAAGGPVAVDGSYTMSVVGETFRLTATPGSTLPAIGVEGTGTIQYIGLV